MKLLLVVGLAAVVIVILIAVFLSVRLGRGDDHEEPVTPGTRDRGRRDAEDSRWRDADARDSRRPRGSARAGGNGRHPSDEAGRPRYRDRDERRSSREQAARDSDYDYPDQRDPGPSEHPSSPRRPVTAGTRRPGSGDRDRRAGRGGDQRGTGPVDYDTGPSRRPPAGDYHSGPQRAYAGSPAGPLPGAGLPPGEYPAADYPSMEFPSGPLAAADFPSGEYPAAAASTQPGSRSRSKSGPGKNGSGREQPDSRRKPAKAQGAAKGRSRSKRDDDDDWPSMEWDKLTDEQYWAELSADKPLATTARTAQPASEPAPAPAGRGKSRSAKGKPKAATAAPAALLAAAEPTRELPSRRAPGPQREPVTERLPVRSRPQPPVPARSQDGIPAAGRAEVAIPRPAEEPSIAMLSSLASAPPARPHGALDEDPLTSPSFARPAVDSRSYRRTDAQPAGSGGHQQPAARQASAGYDPPDYGPASYRPEDYQAGADYPSPAYDAGGYGSSGPHSALPASPATASVGGGGYQLPEQTGSDYAYPPTLPQQAAPVTWQRPPDEPAPAQGNPYGSYVDPEPASYHSGPVGYQDSHPSGGHSYSPDMAGSYPEQGFSPAPVPYQPAVAAATHPAGAGEYPAVSAYPQAAYPGDGGYSYQQHSGQAPYPDPQEAASYLPGYSNGYPADPYENNGYGYPAAQG
ncbi:MAG TPA: hypothetical protein VG123_19205 [Streptosporangiaceae bacterium]|jgi:hypothetical protein|nr:hypothetical protein [Streptosporangiaceae bacterium]